MKNLKSYFDTFMFITIQSNSFRGLTKKTLTRIFADKTVPIGHKHEKIFQNSSALVAFPDGICGVKITRIHTIENLILGHL